MQKVAIAFIAACALVSVLSANSSAQIYDPAYAVAPYAYTQYYDPYYELHQIHYQLYLRQYGYYPYAYPYVVAAPPAVFAAPVVAAPVRQPLRVNPTPIRNR